MKKRCSRCKRDLPLEAFAPCKREVKGSYCRECHGKRMKLRRDDAFRAATNERARARRRAEKAAQA